MKRLQKQQTTPSERTDGNTPCKLCGGRTKTTNTEQHGAYQTRRYKRCIECGSTITTYEKPK